MEALFAVVRQAGTTVTKTLSGVEKFASAFENIGRVADESTAAFADEVAHKRKFNIEVQRQEFELQLAQRKAALSGKKAKLQITE